MMSVPGDPLSPATALVVGVTSHRDLDPAQLPELTQQLRLALGGLRNQFPELLLIVLSPLAEGGDRLVAEVALELGARLIVPLPLPVELYAQDFATPESRAQFDRLLAQAEVVPLPLPPGDTEQLRQPGPLRDRQYLLAGLYVASHCHVLLALWDGGNDGGLGGTTQIVRYYLGGPLPGARRAGDNLRQMLSGDDDSLALHLPVRRESDQGTDAPAPEPAWLTSSGGRPLAAGMPPDYRRIFERMQVFERDRRHHAPPLASDPAQDPAEFALHAVDAMAVYYQRRMLTAMRAIHALAVLMGLSFLLYSDLGAPDWMLWVFLLFFVIGLLITVAARRRDWHRKYIDYRALAEGLRVQSFWRRAGLSMTGDPEFAHDNFMQKQDVELGWIRNVMRQIGLLPLPDADDPAQAVDAVIEEWVGRPGTSGQLAYYERKAALRERHHLRTRALGAGCLWAGIGISLFLALFHGGLSGAIRNVLVTTMGALSLVAAVHEAYAYRKADKELVKQYRFMHRIYRNARIALDAAESTQARREILRALGEAALAEHAEWALMHRDRPIEHGRP
ncbi:MAG TPA: hypothetical protein VHF02_02505 [Luteimonas sp.]|nr:hypothetical protein [Luteimonas sp.]